MIECSLSGRGQGHMRNFYIVDLENFATASRRYTGDIHNSTVVCLFTTHCLQLNLLLYTIGLVRTCRISSFCTVLRGNWQDYYWQDASRGHSAIAELLVEYEIVPLLSTVRHTSSGLDDLPYWLFQKCSFELAGIVTSILNKCFSTGTLPSQCLYHLLPPQRPLHDALRVRGLQFQCIYKFHKQSFIVSSPFIFLK